MLLSMLRVGLLTVRLLENYILCGLIKFDKVPECFTCFSGICEITATLGPVLKIDVYVIILENIRHKVGVRDIDKIPPYT